MDVRVVDASTGQLLFADSGKGEFEKKDEAKTFAWWNFAGGNAEKVLDPWTPVKVAGDRFDLTNLQISDR